MNKGIQQVYILQGEELYTTIKKAFLECLEQPQNLITEKDVKHQVELLTTEELAERLSVSSQTVHRWRKKNRISYLKIGKSFRYDYLIVLHELKNKKGGTK
jgi:excisionase family DNA binding protein